MRSDLHKSSEFSASVDALIIERFVVSIKCRKEEHSARHKPSVKVVGVFDHVQLLLRSLTRAGFGLGLIREGLRVQAVWLNTIPQVRLGALPGTLSKGAAQQQKQRDCCD